MNHDLMTTTLSAFKALFGARLPKASKRRRASVDYSMAEQLELRKLLTATISDFSLSEITGTTLSVLSGTVEDDWGSEGVVVDFGGVLAGTSVNVDSDGTFSYVFDYSSLVGDVTAQANSWDGTTSNVVTIPLSIPV